MNTNLLKVVEDYLNGKGNNPVSYLRPLAESGDELALVLLGLCLVNGVEGEDHIKEGLEMYARAEDSENEVILYILYGLYLKLDGEESHKAIKCLKKSADLGYAPAIEVYAAIKESLN